MKKIFIIFSILLFLGMIVKSYVEYTEIKKIEKKIALNESESLSVFMKSFRKTYQKVFIKNNIEINKNTVNLLPVKTIREISKTFSKKIDGKIIIRTVSDRPRNPKNMANEFEKKMMDYFRHHKKEEKLTKTNNVYNYTSPLIIRESCLQCHGKKEDAIPKIRNKYNNAYNYKLGEVRGLINIEIKEDDLLTLMYSELKERMLWSFSIYLILVSVMFFLLNKLIRRDKKEKSDLKENLNEKISKINKQTEVFETLFDKSANGLLIMQDTKFIKCNQKAVEILGYKDKDDILGRDILYFSPVIQEDGRDSHQKWFEMITKMKKENECEFKWTFLTNKNNKKWVNIYLKKIILNDSTFTYISWKDITKQVDTEEKLDYQAHHDTLTGLPNRLLFNDRLGHSLEVAKRENKKVALLFIDLDNFKKINDTLGHNSGDKVLISISNRIKENIRMNDTLSRIGGDEFTIIMENVSDLADIKVMTSKILLELKKPITIEGHTFYISCSIGVSLYPDHGLTKGELVKYADVAMYTAKNEGKNNCQFYSEDMTEMAYEKVKMEEDLRNAIKNNEFVLHYQPQIDIKSGKLVGVEALIRWIHKGKMIRPDLFLPLATETGLIIEIDEWVMKTALKQTKEWHNKGYFEGNLLALNLSIRQLMSDSFFNHLKESLEEIDYKPEWLELEITEGEMMSNPEEAIKKLEVLKGMGIKIAIDDFGTGYSSLAYLKELPVDILKIDKSFIDGIPNNSNDVAIVNVIISLAKNLGLKTIAEGVETEEQSQFLKENDCDIIQGYFYSKPILGEEIEKKYYKL